jgi:hypothetical protein
MAPIGLMPLGYMLAGPPGGSNVTKVGAPEKHGLANRRQATPESSVDLNEFIVSVSFVFSIVCFSAD